jgi:hypothetical protein
LLVAARTNDDALRNYHYTTRAPKFAKKFNVFHQIEFRKTIYLRKDFAPAEKTVIAAAHSQQQSGVMTETVSQSINGISPRNSDAKKSAGNVSILQSLFHFSDRSGWHLSIGMKKPENTSARDLGTRIHLPTAIWSCLHNTIAMVLRRIDRSIIARAICDNHFRVRGTFAQVAKKFVNKSLFVQDRNDNRNLHLLSQLLVSRVGFIIGRHLNLTSWPL